MLGQDANFQFKIANYGSGSAPNTYVGVNVDGTTVGLINVGTISAEPTLGTCLFSHIQLPLLFSIKDMQKKARPYAARPYAAYL